jgi:hypothetical protein
MDMSTIIELVGEWKGAHMVRPAPGDGTPEIAWGDVFFYYAPDQVMPMNRQPFATIVTKDYPDDDRSKLYRQGHYRVNIHPGRDSFSRWTQDNTASPDSTDTIFAHPVYGGAGWLAVINPGPQTSDAVQALLREAFDLDRHRYERRQRHTAEDDK